MAISKVTYAGNTLIDLTGDTVTPENLLSGATAHAANGEEITGIVEDKKGELEAQIADLRSQIGSLNANLAESFEPSYTEITTGFTSPVVSGKVGIIKWGKFCVAVISIDINSQLEDWKRYKICEISQKAYKNSFGVGYGINNQRPVILEVDGTTLFLRTQGGTFALADTYQGQVAYVSN